MLSGIYNSAVLVSANDRLRKSIYNYASESRLLGLIGQAEMKKEIEVLTSEIRTLSYSSTKEAAEKILQLQRRRRELRAQLEAAES